MHKKYAVFIIGLLLCLPVQASDSPSYLTDAQKVGEGRLTYLLWDVYDARLYAPDGQWDENEPFALTLHYLRSLKGEAIADRSVEEMRKQGFEDEVKLAAWHSQMRNIFPDVENGTELTGLYTPGEPTRFYQNGKLMGAVQDAEFGQWFFDIWLSEQTTEPELRIQLLGLSDD